ncbi:MAG: hypothetical protein K2X82_09415 [Gemmataceae bacterium]|nr:hypothetical protein [Gemmataceae bacterium]
MDRVQPQPPTAHDLFQSLCAATVRHACVVLRLADSPHHAPRIMELLRTAPRNTAEARDPDFYGRSFCCESLRIASRYFSRPGGHVETETALKDAEWHFLGVIPRLPANQRRQLEAAVAGVISGMLLGQKDLPLRAG